MKLNRSQIAAVRRQTGLAPLPAEMSAEAGLANRFGDQTFYVDREGVYVFEQIEQPSGEEPLMAIKIARVSEGSGDEDEVKVQPVHPQTTTVLVDLAA